MWGEEQAAQRRLGRQLHGEGCFQSVNPRAIALPAVWAAPGRITLLQRPFTDTFVQKLRVVQKTPGKLPIESVQLRNGAEDLSDIPFKLVRNNDLIQTLELVLPDVSFEGATLEIRFSKDDFELLTVPILASY